MSEPIEYLILGCGYTGGRVAERLLARGKRVAVTTREPERLDGLARMGAEVWRVDAERPFWPAPLPAGVRVLDSVPSLRLEDGRMIDPTHGLMTALGDAPARVVYLSTTGVYGAALEVDESTPAAPRTERERLRVEAEQAVLAGQWSSLVLRPAAIYGPGRGVHVSLPKGLYPLVGDGGNYVSRVHVDDLAAIAEAALDADGLTGCYPVADLEPCTSLEIATFCAGLLGVPLPERVAVGKVHETRQADRKVNGRAIADHLGISLRYPSYRIGIPNSL